MKKRAYLLLLVLPLLLAGSVRHAAAAGKISITPAAVTLSEGQSQAFSVQLDSPIVTASGDPNLYIDITASNPDKVTISSSTITYTPSEWAQTKTFTVTVPTNDVYGDSLHIIFTGTGRSNAAYYSGYTAGFAINTTDTTAVPAYNDPQDDVTPPPGTSDHTTPPDTYKAQEEALKRIPPRPTNQVIKKTYSAQARLDPHYTSPDDAVTQPVKSGLQKISYTYFSKNATPAQKISAYFLLFMSVGVAILVPIAFIRRNVWLRKAKERHERWFYRHLYKRSKKRHSKRKKSRKK